MKTNIKKLNLEKINITQLKNTHMISGGMFDNPVIGDGTDIDYKSKVDKTINVRCMPKMTKTLPIDL